MNENQTPVTPQELNDFVSQLSASINSVSHSMYPTCPPNWSQISVDAGGKKYARLVSHREGNREAGGSAYGFVDLTNGDILKAAGWKAPAKHARGNIRVGSVADGWNGACTHYGVAYLR
jgi:hypothetical protein